MNKRAKKPAKIIKQIMKQNEERSVTEDLSSEAIAQFAEREKKFEEYFGSGKHQD